MWKVWAEIHLCPKVKYSFHYGDFNKTLNYPILFFWEGGYLLYQILSNVDKKCKKMLGKILLCS